jgi:uncharacterized protein (TIGR02569 family)
MEGASPGVPPDVLNAWGAADIEPLEGGQGEAFRAGDLVLKPAPEPAHATWLADKLDALPDDANIRIVRPVRARGGDWVVHGWSAWRWLEGKHRADSWEATLDASQRFHHIVAHIGWSPAMIATNRWSAADRVAWGEADAPLPAEAERLLSRRRPVQLPAQMIHADLGGNVLFHDTLPPAVIDVSPYWRPAAYADAIVVADAVAWSGAGDEVVERLLRAQGDQLLLRAVLFRVATDPGEVKAYERVITLITA